MNAYSTVQNKARAKPTSVPVSSGLLQRCTASTECDECRKNRESMLRRAAVNSSPVSEVPPIVHEVLRSPGHPLDNETSIFMEHHFGSDFSSVRIHADSKAAESARAVNALAYTVGHDVVFGNGQYKPSTIRGRGLLAHELTHVVQQAKNSYHDNQPLKIGLVNEIHEEEAEKSARTASIENTNNSIPANPSHIRSMTLQTVLQRQVAPHLDPECEDLLAQIIARLVELKERAEAIRLNKLNLPQSGPMSIEGHQQQFRNKQTNLRGMLQQWDTNSCGGPGYVPQEAWRWATAPTPRPVVASGPARRVPIRSGSDQVEYERPRDGTRITTRDVAKVAGGVAAGYIAYRVIRFLPSLLPPLWWTAPANAAIP